MKTKITFISVVTLSIALLLTSCSGKGTVSTTEPQNTTAEDSTASADNSNTKLDDLYQQDNSATQGLQPVNQKFTTVTAFFENRLSSTALPS